MGALVRGILVWTAAFLAVFSFYAHTVFNVPSSEITPVIAGLLAASLVALAVVGFGDGYPPEPVGGARTAAFWGLILALAWFVASAAVGALSAPMGVADWGLFAIQTGTPALLLVTNRRGDLLRAIGWLCVGFACLDLALNVLDAAGVAPLVKHLGDRESGGTERYGVHYLGLCGNTFAEGTVAMIAVGFLALKAATVAIWGPLRLAFGAVMLAILAGMGLIHSRTYLVVTLLAPPLLLFRSAWRIPPVLPMAALAGAFIWRMFIAPTGGFEDNLRAWLVLDGVDRALLRPWFGSGVFYRATFGLTANYNQLRAAGITESGVVDLADTYGIPAAALLMSSCILAASAWRKTASWPAVMLTLMTAELVFAAPLSGLLGSLFFFACLVWVILDEPRQATEPRHPQ